MQVWQPIRVALVSAVGLALTVSAALVTRQPAVDAGVSAALSERFSFEESVLASDPANPRAVRQVQPALHHIRAWISAIGASAGLADFRGDGLADEYCLVDPRDDSVTIGAVPGHPAPFARFPLVPRGVPYGATTAPMGCVPADLNQDGHPDVLVYFWGRPPLAYLRRPGTDLGPGAFVTVDVAPDPTEIWNSGTANVLDLDGDGGLDLVIGNYFPDGARVLDPAASSDQRMRMNESMSDAGNGGRNRILRLVGTTTTAGGLRIPRYQDASGALTDRQARSWTLAIGAQDLDRDGLPELYVANDFGPDNLLHNRSEPGEIRLAELTGRRGATTPKSKVLGNGSFKGMGVTFTDLNRDWRPDILVSNITTPFGLHESNHAFVSTGTGPITGTEAPYRDDSEPLGLSRSGWAWDIKAADFDGDGTDELVQALGFVRGERNRWPELQELAMTNDAVLQYPQAWPDFVPGDDIAGYQRNAFFARDGRTGRFVNLAAELGLSDPGPTRGLAVGDVDHDGKPDLIAANQWAPSIFLRNTGPDRAYLGLRLLLPPDRPEELPRPAVGAAVVVTTPDGDPLRDQLFPANGHAGANAPELLFGLGATAPGPLAVTVTWRDRAGLHTMTRTLRPGWHTLVLEDGTG